MNKKFFKIIVSNCNGMAYIKRCLDSILSQTYTDFAIALVDGISDDVSNAFAKMYARKNPENIITYQTDQKSDDANCIYFGLHTTDISADYSLFIDSSEYLSTNNDLLMLHTSIVKNNYPDSIKLYNLNCIKNTLVNSAPTKSTVINVDSIMDCAYCITIDNAKYKLFNKIFSNAGFNYIPHVNIGCTDPTIKRTMNCKNSHLAIVKNAKYLKLPYVMIFEDDAYPCNNIVNEMKSYLQDIPADANLVMFGWSSCYDKYGRQAFNQKFNKITNDKISGAHAYIIFEKAYDRYIGLMENTELLADNDIMKRIGNSYIINKPLFIQYCNHKSMNNHVGYIFFGDHNIPPKGFPKIETYLK